MAGARLLKRGLREAGHVANEVETEQIVSDGLRGALHERCLSSWHSTRVLRQYSAKAGSQAGWKRAPLPREATLSRKA